MNQSPFLGIPVPMLKLPPWYGGQFGVPGSDTPEGLRLGSESIVYYVDHANSEASDNNDGTDPRYPKATIASAITANNATIDWSSYGGTKSYNWIFIGPGVYAEALTSLPHYCHVVGTGIIGTDGASEIHPTAGSAIAGTQINARWSNIWFEAETAVPVLDFDICNNVVIEHCGIMMGIAGLATMGVQTNNASHMQLYANFFSSGVANLPIGIQFLGGANKFAHSCRIVGNYILAATTGIDIPANCTATNTVIADNFIGGVNLGTGISDLNANTWVLNNFISATDAIAHANSATRCIGNKVINAGVGAVETAGSN